MGMQKHRAGYWKRFDDVYEASSPEVRAVFDDPETRSEAGRLYEVWQECEAQRERYSAGQNKRRSSTQHVSLPGDVDDFCWFLEEMMPGVLALIDERRESREATGGNKK